MTEVFTEARLQEALDAILAMDAPKPEKKARLAEVKALWDEAKAARALAAAEGLRANAQKFLAAMDRVLRRTEALGAGGLLGGASIAAAQGEMAELHARFGDETGLRRTFRNTDGVLEPVRDETVTPPATADELAPPPEAAAPPAAPSESRRYEDLAAEYQAFFAAAEPRPERAAAVRAFAAAAAANRARYEAAGAEAGGVPWWFVAGIHLLESGFRFDRHLHNGDPLTARTKRVPAGHPKTGSPPFTWEASAADALRLQKLDGLSDWSLPRALWRWERYNGFGYRPKRRPSPYLWGMSTVYEKGKFVADGVWDPDAVSAQCGAALLLKTLMRGHGIVVGALRLDEGEEAEAAAAPAAPASPPADFAAFFAAEAPPGAPFAAAEFLVKGGAHEANGLNTDPPRALWPNAVPLFAALTALREAAGAPVRITSCYRSPAYNSAIGGAKQSQHMQFRAADVVIEDGGGPDAWAALARRLRAEGVFSGGVGRYPGFIHIDVRGVNVDF